MAAEFVGFVNQHQVVFLCIPIVIVVFVEYFAQTAVTYKTGIFVDAEIVKCSLPVLFYGWGINH